MLFGTRRRFCLYVQYYYFPICAQRGVGWAKYVLVRRSFYRVVYFADANCQSEQPAFLHAAFFYFHVYCQRYFYFLHESVACLVFAVINAAVLLYLSCPVNGVVMSPYGVMPNAAELCPEFMAIKENFVGIGRSIGIILIMILNVFTQGNLLWQAVALACLSAFQGITVLVASKCLSAVDDVRKNRATEE